MVHDLQWRLGVQILCRLCPIHLGAHGSGVHLRGWFLGMAGPLSPRHGQSMHAPIYVLVCTLTRGLKLARGDAARLAGAPRLLPARMAA